MLTCVTQTMCMPTLFFPPAYIITGALFAAGSIFLYVILSCFVPLKRLVHAKHATANVFPLCTSLPSN